jgi:hypothetical protein
MGDHQFTRHNSVLSCMRASVANIQPTQAVPSANFKNRNDDCLQNTNWLVFVMAA